MSCCSRSRPHNNIVTATASTAPNNKTCCRPGIMVPPAFQKITVKPPNEINPANQWQRIEIQSKDGVLTCSLNGAVVSTAQLPADLEAGHIALQSQGGPIEWRNIRIKELPKTESK